MSITSAVAHAAAAAAAAGAGKKAAQVQLQAELNTDDDWNKFLLRDGLLVIDVYTEWCGPCLGMVGNLKKIKVEIGGDNLHLAVAKADTIECLKRFRNRSEPTWMFIAGGQLLNVVFGADAPRLARTIEQELHNEELVRKGERERPQRAPHELTPPEQEVALAAAARAAERRAREAAAAAAARAARREERARRLDAHFGDVCPALVLPHAQKNLRKVVDALEPFGVVVADKYPLVLGAEGARALAREAPELGSEAAAAALAERPALALVLKKLPDREGNVIELTRKALFGDGLEGEAPRRAVPAEELRADGVPGLFAPADRQQRAAALDLLFPKMVGSVVETPAPLEPPAVAVVLGAWQRRAALAALAHTPGRLLRYGFFADASLDQPRLVCKDIDKYEERPDKDYCETIVLMVAVGVPEEEPPAPPAAPAPEEPRGPPAALLALGPLHVSEDAVRGAAECARFFPPGYSAPDHAPKPKPKKKKKKRQEAKEDAVAEGGGAEPAGEATEAEAEGPGEGDAEGEGEADAEGEGEAEGGSLEDGDDEDTHQDKATSPPPAVG